MDGDTTFTKLFVGGLPWETRGDAVRRHFEQFGEIVEAVVIADKHTSRSKGYGFVRLAHLQFSLLLLLQIAAGLRLNLFRRMSVSAGDVQGPRRRGAGAAGPDAGDRREKGQLQPGGVRRGAARAPCRGAVWCSLISPFCQPDFPITIKPDFSLISYCAVVSGMARLRPAMIASSSSYQGSAPSYFPQVLYAYPYCYG